MRFLRVTLLWVLLLPYCFTFLGAASNQLAITSNRDSMPVRINPIKAVAWYSQTMQVMNDGQILLDDRHSFMTDKSHLTWLGDIFDFKSSIVSVGDLLLDLGNWLDGFCCYVWMALVIYKLKRGDDDRQTASGPCTS